MEWVRVRAEESEKPRDQMHWKATGSVSRNATTPDHRCTGLAQAGEPLTPGSRPHMADALITCTTRKISAAVVSQVFIDNSVRKPKVTIAAPLPGCTREYAASTAATTTPRAVTAASPQRGSCRTAAAWVDVTVPPNADSAGARSDLDARSRGAAVYTADPSQRFRSASRTRGPAGMRRRATGRARQRCTRQPAAVKIVRCLCPIGQQPATVPRQANYADKHHKDITICELSVFAPSQMARSPKTLSQRATVAQRRPVWRESCGKRHFW